MEDLELYLNYLQTAYSLANRLAKLIEEDKGDPRLGLSGEAETLYKQHCDKAADKVKDIQKRIAVLISESSAGLI